MNYLSYPIDHIAVAVFDLRLAIEIQINLFHGKVILEETLNDKGLKLAFVSVNNTLIEFLTPLDQTDTKNTVSKFLAKNGEGLHHICYQVDNILEEIKRIKLLGHTMIDDTPRGGAFNSKIAFIHPKSTFGTLIELCEK